MATVLYITAHPLDHHTSYSLAVGKSFIDTYREANPQDEVVYLDLFALNLPLFDADVLNGWSKVRSGTPFDQLSESEQSKLTRIDEICDQFMQADKYIFVSPMWNLTIPSVLNNYINCICVAGKTYRYTENGVVGLLQHKKALHIQASGGIYSEGPTASLESGNSYLSRILRFVGVEAIDTILVEGMHFMPEQAESIKQNAIIKAETLANHF